MNKPIYHITSVDNLESILAEGGLWCDQERSARQIEFTNIGYANIKDRRVRTAVPCGTGGNVADYVPFYFGPRSPMLFTIGKGNVPGYSNGEDPIIHLVSSTNQVRASGASFVFTDGHATMRLTEFFGDLAELGKIDWNIMTARYWNDTEEDNDRCRRRQAEFLVSRFFPWELVDMIGVKSRTIQDRVQAILQRVKHQPLVRIQRTWYYN